MSKIIDGTTIVTYRGDSFCFTITDLTPGMKIYCGIRDKKYNKLVFPEIVETVDNSGNVSFTISASMSDKLLVKSADAYEIYHWGVKQVNEETGEENTITLGESSFETVYKLKVLNKKVEGLE